MSQVFPGQDGWPARSAGGRRCHLARWSLMPVVLAESR
jgi:hypothetical protein